MIGIEKRVEGGNDDTAWNLPAVLLTDDIVELAVSNEIHVPVSVRIGSGSSDTFAVELRLAGVPLDRVSILLGHSSIRITERH